MSGPIVLRAEATLPRTIATMSTWIPAVVRPDGSPGAARLPAVGESWTTTRSKVPGLLLLAEGAPRCSGRCGFAVVSAVARPSPREGPFFGFGGALADAQRYGLA